MNSIKKNSCLLRKIYAIEVAESFNTGRTKPLLINGICLDTHEKGEYVVKLKGKEVTIQHFVNELICSFIALELGLNVPEPVIVELTEELQKTLVGRTEYSLVGASLGYNFGSEYLNGFSQFTKNQKLSVHQLNTAIHIFLFDAFILNPDRGSNDPQKQNMFTDGKDIIIYDHESALTFVYDLFPSKTPWILRDNDVEWLKKHHFYDYIKSKEKEATDFIDTFAKLDNTFWDKLEALIPDEWKTEHIKPIRQYLGLIVENKEIFKEQLKSIMS